MSFCKRVKSVAVATGMGCASMLSSSAVAGYLAPGYDLQVVQAEQGLPNAGLSYQTNGLWTGSGRDVEMSTSFTLPTATDIHFARLYLDIWGGTANYSGTLTATLNGTALPAVDFGTTGDANAVYDLGQPSVYGSGAGAWQIALGGIASLLHTDGSPNILDFVVSDPAGQFDGRVYGASLVAVYIDPALDQLLDYYLAEADGTLRSTQPNTYASPDQRSLTFAGLSADGLLGATYHAGYTHGNTTTTGSNHLDQLYFNGVALGATSDVSTGDFTSYPPNHLAFDVTGLLANESTVRYSVNNGELGGTGDTYLRANLGILEIRRAIPEPTSLALLGLALAGLGRCRRRPA